MDVFTQALLGSSLAQSYSHKAEIRQAAVIGALAGLLADADILIQSSTDSLLMIEYHRHFSHALIFIPIGALLASLMLWPFFKTKLAFRKIYQFSFLGYCLSGVLDACTSYGTHLFWPFSDERVAWHIISIIDPVFTAILLIAVIFALRRKSSKTARIGLILAGFYLAIGMVQLHRAETLAKELALSRSHPIEQLVVKPTIANLLLWRSIYVANGYYYVDAIHAGIGRQKVYTGNHIKRLDISRLPQTIKPDSVLYKDIRRFEKFSDGYIALHPERSDSIGDVRYAMLPTSVLPLWGIEFDIERPWQHASYRFYRELTAADKTLFKLMLFGEKLPEPR